MTQLCRKGKIMDFQKFYDGEVFDAYDFFGAHLENGGVVFRTYAPNAQRIEIIGEFNNWQEQPMEQQSQYGVWSCFIKDAC